MQDKIELSRFGIPETQIFIEDQSTRTAHQFVNAQKVLEKASIDPESAIGCDQRFSPTAFNYARSKIRTDRCDGTCRKNAQ